MRYTFDNAVIIGTHIILGVDFIEDIGKWVCTSNTTIFIEVY